VVFNTGLTGYQEVLTDPSYAGQIVTMTAPQMRQRRRLAGRRRSRGIQVGASYAGNRRRWRATGAPAARSATTSSRPASSPSRRSTRVSSRGSSGRPA